MSTATFLVSGLGCAVLALYLVHGPLIAVEATRETVYPASRDGLSALLVLILAIALRIQVRPGAAFGCLAAVALAPAVSFAIHALLQPHPFFSVLGGSGLGLLMIPVLRDRGMGSILLTSIIVSLTLVGARHQSLVVAGEFAGIQQLRDMIQEGGKRRHFVAVAEGYPPRLLRALALSLWPPDPTQRIDLVSLRSGSDAERGMSASGWRGLRITATGYQIVEPQKVEQLEILTLGDVVLAAGGPVVQVESELFGSHVLRVLTPSGSLLQSYDNPGPVLRLSLELQAEYARLTSGLPAGMPVVLRVEASFGPGKSPWTVLRLR